MRRVRFGRVALFISLTFALSWGFDLLLDAAGGRGIHRDLGMTPWGMLVPACVALILRLYVFKDSPIYFRAYREKPRWIPLSFVMLTAAYGFVTVLAAAASGAADAFRGIGTALISLWTLFVIFVSGRSAKDAIERSGLGLGNVKWGQRFVFGVVAFLVLQAVLNLATGLGDFQGRADRIYGLAVPGALYPVTLIALFLAVTVIGMPLAGLAAVFGEEYGWRGFLQDELVRMGKVRGVFLVGLIWGAWHIPIIMRGVHTYPASPGGVLLGIVFFVLWGFVQSYAVLKTGSIWIAAFMHGLVNSVYSFLLVYVTRPDSMVLSFGLGVFGLACLAAIVVLILCDPLWRNGQRAGLSSKAPG